MAAKLERTKTPGVFKRGSRYVFSYRVDGKQKWESARSLDQPRVRRSERITDVRRGEHEERSTVTLHEYAAGWVERHQGRGKHSFREPTRDDYRRILKQYVFRYFKPQHKLADVTPQHVAGYIGWLCKQTRPAPTKEDPERRVPIADKSVRNYIGPLSACLAAVNEGLIRANPARDADLPNRQTADHVEHEDVRSMNEQQLAMLLALIPAKHRVFFRLLAATGLRISEAIALQWRHLQLDGAGPHVKVRRGVVRGTLGPLRRRTAGGMSPCPATSYPSCAGSAPTPRGRARRTSCFPTHAGDTCTLGNLRGRVLKPIAGVAWVGFHTLRHTCASLLFKNGRNAKQVQHSLGHHSASFTLDTYIKLLDDDLGVPLELPVLAVATRSMPLTTELVPAS